MTWLFDPNVLAWGAAISGLIIIACILGWVIPKVLNNSRGDGT